MTPSEIIQSWKDSDCNGSAVMGMPHNPAGTVVAPPDELRSKHIFLVTLAPSPSCTGACRAPICV